MRVVSLSFLQQRYIAQRQRVIALFAKVYPRFMPYGMTTTDHTGVRTTVGLGLDGTHFVLERQLGDRVDRFEQARL